jgi:hypothetical protein
MEVAPSSSAVYQLVRSPGAHRSAIDLTITAEKMKLITILLCMIKLIQ